MLINSVAPSSDPWPFPFSRLPAHTDSSEGRPFLDSVWVAGCSFCFSLTEATVPTRTFRTHIVIFGISLIYTFTFTPSVLEMLYSINFYS